MYGVHSVVSSQLKMFSFSESETHFVPDVAFGINGSGEVVAKTVPLTEESYCIQTLFEQQVIEITGERIAETLQKVVDTTEESRKTVGFATKECSIQKTSFQMEGCVAFADGASHSFSVSLSIESQRYSARPQWFEMMDPLVLNLDVPSVRLDRGEFLFDLNMDGEEEILPSLEAGSGFLALDSNENGKIDDGSELFGAASGDGFSDLAEHDDDGNGWIDANDSIFGELKVWYRQESGSMKLLSLQEVGVTAIGVAHGDTAMDLGDVEGSLGRITSTGVFFREGENGTEAKTVQQVFLREKEEVSGAGLVRLNSFFENPFRQLLPRLGFRNVFEGVRLGEQENFRMLAQALQTPFSRSESMIEELKESVESGGFVQWNKTAPNLWSLLNLPEPTVGIDKDLL